MAIIPSEIINETVNRINEIIWWNRGLARLNNADLFTNYNDFINNELIQRKGPYIEYIRKPKRFEKSTDSFFAELGFDNKLTTAVGEVLFGGKLIVLKGMR